MLIYRVQTFLRSRVLLPVALSAVAATSALTDVISVQNTWYHGRILSITSAEVVFDVNCEGNVVRFKPSDLDGVYPQAEIYFLDANGQQYAEPIFECTEPTNVEEASGGGGEYEDWGYPFCDQFLATFGRRPRLSDRYFVFQTYINDGSQDGLGSQTYHFYEEVHFDSGRPIGLIGGKAYRHNRHPQEENIQIWRLGSKRDDKTLLEDIPRCS